MGKFSKIVLLLGRLLLGGFFLIAGILKVLDPATFQHEIIAYQLVNYPVSYLMAYFLPYLEIVLGLGVLLKLRIEAALVIIIGLLFVFILALAWTWMKGIDIQCGCLGKVDFIDGQPAAILRDLFLMLVAIMVYKFAIQVTERKAS